MNTTAKPATCIAISFLLTAPIELETVAAVKLCEAADLVALPDAPALETPDVSK